MVEEDCCWSMVGAIQNSYVDSTLDGRWERTIDDGRGRWTIVGYFGGRTAVEPILGVSLR